MKPDPITQEALLTWLATNLPVVRVEADRAWLWVTGPDLAPLHRNKCQCQDCATRAAIRTALKERGFSFARNGGHVCPSGAIAHWGHSCDHPLPFKRRSKGKGEEGDTDNNNEPQPENWEQARANALAFLGV
jgi:hypothetical protein